MDFPIKYKNGDCETTIFEDGTKIRDTTNGTNVVMPESIDCKITNYCNANCLHCYENSTIYGEHCDLQYAFEVLKDMIPGTEIALGGGNPFSIPSNNLIEFLEKMHDRNIIVNATINQYHIKDYINNIISFQDKKLLYGIGLSYNKSLHEYIIDDISKIKNLVFHFIIGIHSFDDVIYVYSLCKRLNIEPKILLLGYKECGRGKNILDGTKNNIEKWRNFTLRKIMTILSDMIICFDNLAIEQLNVKSILSENEWNSFYMGDDGQYTMFIDFVSKTFAKSSLNERIPINDKKLQVMFNEIKNTL